MRRYTWYQRFIWQKMEILNIVLTFPNVSEQYGHIQTKISKNQHFEHKKWQKLVIFQYKNSNFSKFWCKHVRMVLIRQEKLKQCQNFHFLSYKALISRIWVQTTLYLRKLTFSHLATYVFHTCVVHKAIKVLTKRSTLVD